MPPANDDFANRIVLTGASGSTSGSNVGATTETGEPGVDTPGDGVSGTETVWWEWTAPASGTVQWDTLGSTVPGGGSDLDTVLDVWTGSSLATLALVAANDDAPGGGTLNSLVIFSAVAGTTYYIRVNEYGGGITGDIVLNWASAAVPAITSLSPTSGLYNDTITATGTDLGAVTSARFGALGTVPVLSATSTTVTFQVPSGNGGTYPVSVIAPAGESNTLPFDVLGPVLTSLSPTHGTTGGGSTVTINGDHFGSVTAVHFGSVSASFSVVSLTQIIATIPPSGLVAGSTVAVTVTTLNGTSNSLPFGVDYHTIGILDVRSPDPSGVPYMVNRGCEIAIEGQWIEETQAVRIGSTDCDWYYDPTALIVYVKVPLTLSLAGRQDVSVLDGLGAWQSWHGTYGSNSLALVVLDEADRPFLHVQQALGPTGGSSGQLVPYWPNANAMGLYELDVDPVITQRHLIAGFTHPDTPSNPSIYSDIVLESAWYFGATDDRSLGVTANNQDGLGVGAVGDSFADLGGGWWQTFAIVAYHVDSGFFASQQLQLVRIQHTGSDSIFPLGSPATGPTRDHNQGVAVLPLSGQRFITVGDAYTGSSGFNCMRCITYLADLTTGALTGLDDQTTAAMTRHIGQVVRDAWPIDGGRALVLRADGSLQVISVDGAGLITFGATTNVVPDTDVSNLTVCPDGAGGFWTLAAVGQLLDHYSISGTTITRDSRLPVVSDDGFAVGGAAMIRQTSDRGDVVLVLGGTYSLAQAGIAFVVETANGRAGPLWGWGLNPGVGDVGGPFTSQPRPAVNLVGTTGRTQLVWVPTSLPSGSTPGDTEDVLWATYEIDEFLQPCTPFVRPGGLRWGWPLG